ncbi:MAG: tetratricopeptide repeat protein, partial [Desulfonatronovibrionaceae bacterium]
MQSLSRLIYRMPLLDSPEIVSQAYGLWMIREGELPESVAELLRNSGGWEVAAENKQSLWVFLNREVLFACSHIFNWYRHENIKLSIRVFPVKLNVGRDLNYSLTVDEKILSTTAGRPGKLEIWMHAGLREAAMGIPSLKFELPVTSLFPGLDEWYMFRVSSRTGFKSEFAWLLVIRPARKKDMTAGDRWARQKERLADEVQKMGLNFEDAADSAFVFIQGVRQFRVWMTHIQAMFQNFSQGRELPCHLVCREHSGKSPAFAVLKQQIELDWNLLQPDVLYLPLKYYFLLGHGFEQAHEIRDSGQRSFMDLVGVRLNKNLISHVDQRIDVNLPQSLAGDGAPCFYCGLGLHRPARCPTRNMFSLDNAQEKLEKLSIKSLDQALKKLAQEISAGRNPDDLVRESSDHALVLRAIFSINYPCQHRTIRLVWRSRGNDWPAGLRKLAEPEESRVLGALESLRLGRTGAALSLARRVSLRNPKDYQPRTLMGIAALEKDNAKEADSYFQEARNLGYTTLHKVVHSFLRGRLAEVNNDTAGAQSFYQEALKLCPGMLEARYRILVCLIKNGHLDHALGKLKKLIHQEPGFFNLVLIDPELKGAHAQLMVSLNSLWKKSGEDADQAARQFAALDKKIKAWFLPDSESRARFAQRLDFLKSFLGIENYAARMRIIRGVGRLMEDISKSIQEEVLGLNTRKNELAGRLDKIRSQLSWFPLAGLVMKKFNKVSARVEQSLK